MLPFDVCKQGSARDPVRRGAGKTAIGKKPCGNFAGVWHKSARRDGACADHSHVKQSEERIE